MAQQLTFITCRKIGIHKYPDEYQIALNKNHKTKVKKQEDYVLISRFICIFVPWSYEKSVIYWKWA